MNERHPIVRLHLWLDTEGGMFFGSGRAQLLEGIERCGSLKKAAEEIGMSYRAAWGKIKQSEQMLGVQLIERVGDRREGYRLTEFGQLLKDKFMLWFDEVEKEALKKAQEIFPWPAQGYRKSLGRTPFPAGSRPQAEPAGRTERGGAAGEDDKPPRRAAPRARPTPPDDPEENGEEQGDASDADRRTRSDAC